MPRKRGQPESDDESLEGDINKPVKEPGADWGKTKFDYYFTDYVDKDYPSALNAKEERGARAEQEEALRIQKRLLSTLDKVNYAIAIDDEAEEELEEREGNVLESIQANNRDILAGKQKQTRSRKKVKFDSASQEAGSDECELNSGDEDEDDEESDDGEEDCDEEPEEPEQAGRKRRPINMAIQKNRGLTPYKKKEHRNPRVKHKLKYKKALSKRRHLVKEAKVEYHRYSGETSGIKTSTIRSIKLC